MGAVKMLGLGECPPGYNPKVHGPYDPAINYGKKDIPLGQVKISELPGWLARRNWTPAGIARVCLGVIGDGTTLFFNPRELVWLDLFTGVSASVSFPTWPATANSVTIESTNIIVSGYSFIIVVRLKSFS